MACPNVNSPEWQRLVGKIGIYDAFAEFIRNGETIPNSDGYEQTIKGVNYALKISDAIIRSPRNQYTTDKAVGFFNDLKRFGAPQVQIDMLKNYIQKQGIASVTKGELLAAIASEMSYMVEVDLSTISTAEQVDEGYLDSSAVDFGTNEIAPTTYYESLNVPGGTNYRENEIRTPGIIPSIKGHAQFATDKGIGWFRQDEKLLDFSKMLEMGIIKKVDC